MCYIFGLLSRFPSEPAKRLIFSPTIRQRASGTRVTSRRHRDKAVSFEKNGLSLKFSQLALNSQKIRRGVYVYAYKLTKIYWKVGVLLPNFYHFYSHNSSSKLSKL